MNAKKLHRILEYTNHLSNVLTVLSDKKSYNSTSERYSSQVVSTSDYYPFGLSMYGKQYDSGRYRFGFNGKENDTEYGSSQLVQDYGFRIYNPSIGRFLSEDPLTKQYPELTPYQFASNTPIQAIDLDGLEAAFVNFDARASYVAGTANLSLTVAMDLEGNIGLLVTPSLGLGLGWGVATGMSWGINFNTDNIAGLQGWGSNTGGFISTGPCSFSGEFNAAFETANEDGDFATMEGVISLRDESTTVGFTVSVLPNGTPLPGVGFGFGGYTDVGYTYLVGAVNVVDLYEEMNRSLSNLNLSLEENFGLNKEDMIQITGVLDDKLDEIRANRNDNQTNSKDVDKNEYREAARSNMEKERRNSKQSNRTPY